MCRLWVETFLPNDCLLYGGDSNHWTEPINLTNNFERNASSKERVQNALDVSVFVRYYFLQVLKPSVHCLFFVTLILIFKVIWRIMKNISKENNSHKILFYLLQKFLSIFPRAKNHL